MRKLYRFLLSFYALLTILTSLFFLSALLIHTMVQSFQAFLLYVKSDTVRLLFALFLLVFLVVFSIYIVLNAWRTGRLTNTRLKSNDLGVIDIDVHALENIALNSAKISQAGIKTAKARVLSDQTKGIVVEMEVNLYSDVEIPTQMSKIQDRIKKDIERFTGIPVHQVMIRVGKIELLGAKIEQR